VVFVVGAAGLVGSHLVDRLLAGLVGAYVADESVDGPPSTAPMSARPTLVDAIPASLVLSLGAPTELAEGLTRGLSARV
jgi:nucleoside-diphosphate-sugar epimerase